MFKKLISEKTKIIQFKDIISILLIFIILFSLTNVFASSYVSTKNKVTDRNLAMFASIAYTDLENISNYNIRMSTNINKLNFVNFPMVTDKELSSITPNTKLLGFNLSSKNENLYEFLFSGLASTDEVRDWKIVNYIKSKVTNAGLTAEFTAMTFKRGNNIVIAYRGTDGHDINEWGQDFLYGLIEYAGQEAIAQQYAKSIAQKYKNCNIYVTGHSLGGYLAQIGGSAIVNKYNVKAITYFNGMGLKFWSNLLPTMSKKLQKGISNIDDFLKENSILNRTQDEAISNLKKYKKNGGTILSYYINGDLVSSFGTHIGGQIGADPHPICINSHNGNTLNISTGTLNSIISQVSKLIKLIKLNILNKSIDAYIKQYQPASLMDYIWITHETASFFGVLAYEDNSLPPNITATFTTTPSKIKINKESTARLTIVTTGGVLADSNLKPSNFTVSNKNSLKITSVTKTEVKNITNGKIYIYTLKLKGGKILGSSTITLKPNILKLKITSKTTTSVFDKTSNNILISNSIKTTLF